MRHGTMRHKSAFTSLQKGASALFWRKPFFFNVGSGNPNEPSGKNSFVVTVVPPPSPKKTVISSHHIRQKLSPTSHDSSKNQLRNAQSEHDGARLLAQRHGSWCHFVGAE